MSDNGSGRKEEVQRSHFLQSEPGPITQIFSTGPVTALAVVTNKIVAGRI